MSNGSEETMVPNTGTTKLTEETIDSFIDDYYQQIADDDRAKYESSTLRNRALKHWELARNRPPGTAKVAIVNEDDQTRHYKESIVYIVTDDMPFLVDSVTAEVVRQNAAITLVVHPMFVAARGNADDELISVAKVPAYLGVSSGDTAAMPDISHLIANGNQSSHLESWIAIEISQQDEAAAEALIDGLTRVLGDVRAAVEDWQPMRQKAVDCAAELAKVTGGDQVSDLREAEELLRWMDAGNFTFLGYREYDLVTEAGEDVLINREGSGLGLLRDAKVNKQVQHLTEAGRRKAREKRALVITKANSRSTVHRTGYLDYIGVKSFDAEGNVNGEKRFIGLFASVVYTGSVRKIPVVREKVNQVLRHFGFPPDSHSGKDLFAVLETYPRDELFQIEVADLIAIADGIMRLQERRRTRLFLRQDIYGRFMSALIFIPRDRYTTAVRKRIEAELTQTFGAVSIDFEARMSESALARLFFRIRLPKDAEAKAKALEVDAGELEARLVTAARSWSEGLTEVLSAVLPLDQAQPLAAQWAEAFPASYRVDFEIEDAIEDLRRFEDYDRDFQNAQRNAASAECGPGMKVYLPEGVDDELEEDARVKLYMARPKSLSQILPFFHNLGLEVLDERPFEIQTADGRDFFLYDLGLKYPQGIDPIGTGDLL